MIKLSNLFFVGYFTMLTPFISVNAAANFQMFNKINFELMKQENLGKQWLMVLWSVDCPACFKELALLEKLHQLQPDIAVIIVNADDNDEIDNERKKVIASYNLSDLSHYYFADAEGDASRYLIDSNWYGELPRSYFVTADGAFHGKSGLIDEQLLKKWLLVK